MKILSVRTSLGNRNPGLRLASCFSTGVFSFEGLVTGVYVLLVSRLNCPRGDSLSFSDDLAM